MNESASGPQRRRRRPALACEKCRRRKIKCDRNTPCDQCIRSKSETCAYLPDDAPVPAGKKRRVGISHTTNTSTTPSTTSHESPSSTANIPAAGAFDALTDQFSIGGNSTTDPSKERASTVRAPLDQLHQLRHKLPDPANTESAEPATVSSPIHNDALPMKGVFEKTRLFGQSHWMNSIEQV